MKQVHRIWRILFLSWFISRENAKISPTWFTIVNQPSVANSAVLDQQHCWRNLEKSLSLIDQTCRNKSPNTKVKGWSSETNLRFISVESNLCRKDSRERSDQPNLKQTRCNHLFNPKIEAESPRMNTESIIQTRCNHLFNPKIEAESPRMNKQVGLSSVRRLELTLASQCNYKSEDK